MATETEDSVLDNEDGVMSSLIYPEDSDGKKDNPLESLSDPSSAEPTQEPGSPSKKLQRNRPWNPIVMPYQNLLCPLLGVRWGTYLQETS